MEQELAQSVAFSSYIAPNINLIIGLFWVGIGALIWIAYRSFCIAFEIGESEDENGR